MTIGCKDGEGGGGEGDGGEGEGGGGEGEGGGGEGEGGGVGGVRGESVGGEGKGEGGEGKGGGGEGVGGEMGGEGGVAGWEQQSRFPPPLVGQQSPSRPEHPGYNAQAAIAFVRLPPRSLPHARMPLVITPNSAPVTRTRYHPSPLQKALDSLLDTKLNDLTPSMSSYSTYARGSPA